MYGSTCTLLNPKCVCCWIPPPLPPNLYICCISPPPYLYPIVSPIPKYCCIPHPLLGYFCIPPQRCCCIPSPHVLFPMRCMSRPVVKGLRYWRWLREKPGDGGGKNAGNLSYCILTNTTNIRQGSESIVLPPKDFFKSTFKNSSENLSNIHRQNNMNFWCYITQKKI